MKLSELAERVRRSERTVMRWVDKEILPAPSVRVGKTIEWRDGVIMRWLRRWRGKVGGKNVYVRDRTGRGPPRKRVARRPRRAARKAAQ